MKLLKKNDRLIDIETDTEWVFNCKTRGPDASNGPDNKPSVTWTCVLYNKAGERRFIPESKMGSMFKRRETPAATSGNSASSEA
jgi:hypothetical protein